MSKPTPCWNGCKKPRREFSIFCSEKCEVNYNGWLRSQTQEKGDV